MEREKIIALVKEMTLEEKVGLTSGQDGWFLKAVERLKRCRPRWEHSLSSRY